MDARSNAAERPGPVTWPLVGSLVLTGIVVGFVCVPPMRPLRTWGQVVLLACLYLSVAACVHALAVWAITRIQREGGRFTEWAMVWPAVWGAWIAVVWLPLLALLTYERSMWVAFVLPLTASFSALYLRSRWLRDEADEFSCVSGSAHELFALEETPRLWRVLLPSVVVAIVADAGIALLAAGHARFAGMLLAADAAHLTDRFLQRSTSRDDQAAERSMRRASAGNSAAVWMLTAVALLPFLAGMSLAIGGVLGMPGVHAARHPPLSGLLSSRGYRGIILVRPHKAHEIITPVLTSHADGIARSRMIPFDGTYWYFKSPDTRPAPNARIVPGDPLKGEIKSTDYIPLVMEAHQRLGADMKMSCCHALELRVVNADAIPGAITMEVLLRDSHAKAESTVSLGSKVLQSSTVSPMPLHRAPVSETLSFQIPRRDKGRTFDEITVKIRPERSRSLAGPHVAVEGFLLEP